MNKWHRISESHGFDSNIGDSFDFFQPVCQNCSYQTYVVYRQVLSEKY